MLDRFYDEQRNAYIFSEFDLQFGLVQAIFVFLKEHPDWSVRSFGEDYETDDTLYILAATEG